MVLDGTIKISTQDTEKYNDLLLNIKNEKKRKEYEKQMKIEIKKNLKQKN